MVDVTLEWATFIVSALGTVFMGIGALKQVAARLVVADAKVVGLREPVICPNCGQPFDAWFFPRIDGYRKVTCPRCSYTFEA